MDVRAVLLDLQGVLYEAGTPFPGAREAVEHMAAAGLSLRFLTNTTTRPAHAIAERMRDMGFVLENSQLFTPVMAARGVLQDRQLTRAHLAADPSLADDLEGFTLCDSDVEAIILGDLEQDFTWQRLNELFAMLRAGAQLIALHKNRYCRRGEDLGLDLGPFVAALEYATREEATVVGKPSPAFFEMAIRDMNADPSATLMVGDDIDSDIGGGAEAGLMTVQVMTGKFTKGDTKSAVQPSHRVTSIADLPGLLGI
ncbi:MAG: TIGR01458 family HAD-type hydrolase [Pseudomonadota bacterium]